MDQVTEMRQIGAYYDNDHYPRGFGKHGDFTVKQAAALHDYGMTMSMLAKGELAPISTEEQRFINVCSGELAAESFLEKTWMTYQSKIATSRRFFSPFNSLPSAQEEAESTYVDEDDELVA